MYLEIYIFYKYCKSLIMYKYNLNNDKVIHMDIFENLQTSVRPESLMYDDIHI